MFPRDEDQQRELAYNEQLKTNELLEQIIVLLTPKTMVNKPVNTTKPTRNQGRKT